ncbi:hypothetical protein NL676_030626 [Syzygium grande]|nr:hypothetical protein NL676_030626 [Syzygium grande]
MPLLFLAHPGSATRPESAASLPSRPPLLRPRLLIQPRRYSSVTTQLPLTLSPPRRPPVLRLDRLDHPASALQVGLSTMARPLPPAGLVAKHAQAAILAHRPNSPAAHLGVACQLSVRPACPAPCSWSSRLIVVTVA